MTEPGECRASIPACCGGERRRLFSPLLSGLAERFGGIATHAKLEAKGDAVGAQALLEHFRTLPFEMPLVGEKVPNAKCGR